MTLWSELVYDAPIVDDDGVVVGRGDEVGKLLGPLGAEVMNVLWSASAPLTVRAVMDQLNRRRADPLAYTTVMTVLTRVAERGAAKRTPAGRGFVYEPMVKDAAELAVRDVVRDHGDAAISYFIDQARSDPRLLRRLERLLEADPRGPDPDKPSAAGLEPS